MGHERLQLLQVRRGRYKKRHHRHWKTYLDRILLKDDINL